MVAFGALTLSSRLPPIKRISDHLLLFHRDTATLQKFAHTILFVFAIDVVIASLVRLTDLPTGGWIFAVAMVVGGVAAFLLNRGMAPVNWQHGAVIVVLLVLWGGERRHSLRHFLGWNGISFTGHLGTLQWLESARR